MCIPSNAPPNKRPNYLPPKRPFLTRDFEIEVVFEMGVSGFLDTQDGLRQEYDVHA